VQPPKYYPDNEYSDSYGSGGYHPKDISFTLKESLAAMSPAESPGVGTITYRRWVCRQLCAAYSHQCSSGLLLVCRRRHFSGPFVWGLMTVAGNRSRCSGSLNLRVPHSGQHVDAVQKHMS
jgi:hypothetical protein